MSVLTWARDRWGQDRDARRVAEDDAPADAGMSRRRPTGGVPSSDTQDRNGSTGTTPNATFVGRASGDEPGDTGLSGAEARALYARDRDGRA